MGSYFWFLSRYFPSPFESFDYNYIQSKKKKKIKRIDVDECLTNTGECSPNANCKNVDGGFECGCKEGYSGDGFSCQKKSENNQALGIGIGVSFGLLAFISLVLLILFFLRRKVNLFLSFL